MKKSEFLLEVMAELDNIKAKATKEELSRLNIESFYVNSPNMCIYGLMTGICTSNRAKELSPKVYYSVGSGNSFAEQSFYKMGHPCFTALEKYLYMVRKPTHSKIIDYLTGKIAKIQLR